MTDQEILTNFWHDINNGEQGDVEGLIWQKENGQWVALFASPLNNRLMSVAVQYNPWTGEKLPNEVGG